MSNAESISDAASSNLNQPFDTEWLDLVGIPKILKLGGDMFLEIYSSVTLVSSNEKPGEYYTHRDELYLPHIKTRRQLLSLIALLKPDRIQEMNVIAGGPNEQESPA